MDKKKLETEYSSDDDEKPKNFFEKILKLIRENWLALLFALIIALITIIVVPIIYSIDKAIDKKDPFDLRWNIEGITIVNQSNKLDGILNDSFGLISSIRYDINQNLIYILDKKYNRLTEYSIEDKKFNLTIGYLNGTNGSNDNSLSSPNDFHLTDQIIYIADTFNHRILQWNIQQQKGLTILNNQLNQPMSLTMDNNSNIYIADYGNNRIVCYNIISSNFTIIIEHHDYYERHKYVYTPISIKYDLKQSSLIIAQEQGYNVIRWRLNETSWTLIAGSASSELNGTSRTLFMKLCSIDIISDVEATLVADCYNHRIQFYQGDLQKGRTVAGVINAPGNNSYILNYPTAITYDEPSRNIYIADANNCRIQQFLRIY